jgi:hypothetical protein
MVLYNLTFFIQDIVNSIPRWWHFSTFSSSIQKIIKCIPSLGCSFAIYTKYSKKSKTVRLRAQNIDQTQRLGGYGILRE